jgi:hypothetical protein
MVTAKPSSYASWVGILSSTRQKLSYKIVQGVSAALVAVIVGMLITVAADRDGRSGIGALRCVQRLQLVATRVYLTPRSMAMVHTLCAGLSWTLLDLGFTLGPMRGPTDPDVAVVASEGGVAGTARRLRECPLLLLLLLCTCPPDSDYALRHRMYPRPAAP